MVEEPMIMSEGKIIVTEKGPGRPGGFKKATLRHQVALLNTVNSGHVESSNVANGTH